MTKAEQARVQGAVGVAQVGNLANSKPGNLRAAARTSAIRSVRRRPVCAK